jgi:hypothetical protein
VNRIVKSRSLLRTAGIAAAASIALTLGAGSASAHWGRPDWHHGGWHHGWSGGYYPAPPVVYGDPYAYGYYPPPGVGINLPGVHIGIR